MPEIKIHHNNKTDVIKVDKNISLLEALTKHGYDIESTCSGNSTCGKCRVIVNSSNIAYTREETDIFSEDDIHRGIHLSCRIKVTDDIEITLIDNRKSAFILTDISEVYIKSKGTANKHALILPEPSINDQRPDDVRIIEQVNMLKKESEKNEADFPKSSKELQFNGLNLSILKRLPDIIRKNQYQVTVIKILNEITGVETGDTTNKLYGVAIDIGTTTIAAYLYELAENKFVAVESMLNPQKKYGADVISRIDYSSESKDNGIKITNLIRNALTDLINELVCSTGHSLSDIYLVTIAGNTTMLHILLGLPCRNIAIAPFIPVTLSDCILNPIEIGLEINEAGRVLVMPSVSAYIGADTVAAVLSAKLHFSKEIVLLVDIGTNGEIVFSNRGEMYACSTAAGPAFEGANIYCGTGGVDGAISEVSIQDNKELIIKTIGGYNPIGICGSGIVDAVACMLQLGLIDETGRILDKDELPEDVLFYKDRFIEIKGQNAFILAFADAGVYGGQIVITQKDIREVQNAKAAIQAGIRVLIKEAGYSVQKIQKVYLAGGFGNYMRTESAIAIGLLPKKLIGRVQAIGNAAGAGAVLSLLSEKEYSEACQIPKKIRYIELSSNADFVEEYTNNMLF
ncbi:MAG: ASKHA domain-containing protein [Ruminiclostridium sp.]|nr:ASKHA domain-containing protein [Ruminiclostridium sp.]